MQAQTLKKTNDGRASGERVNRADREESSQRVNKKDDMPPASEYKIIDRERDTTVVDTSLSIQKYFKANYLRQDNFELIQFHNVGMTYNKLGYNFRDFSLNPTIGATAKHYNYTSKDEIYYYETPTPLTEFYFKTVLEQGQNLKSFFTTNLNPRLNFSIGYEALNSLGEYVHARSTANNFKTSFNYRNKSDRYFLRFHFTSQDLEQQENGGLTSEGIENFEEEVPEFENRASLAVQFQDAFSRLWGNRFYLDQEYILIRGNDSTQNNQVRIAHEFSAEDKNYSYAQGEANEYFGPSLEDEDIKNEVKHFEYINEFKANYYQRLLGKFEFSAKITDYRYEYNSIIVQNDGNVIPNLLNGNIYSLGGSYANKIGRLSYQGEAKYNFAGDFDGSFLNGQLNYKLTENLNVNAHLSISSRAPNLNYLLFQSAYENYNWFNDFSNINTQILGGEISHKKYGKIEASLTQINNFTYFGTVGEAENINEVFRNVEAFQATDQDVRYAKLKATNDMKFGVFGMHHTLMYQNTLNGAKLLPTPELVTRNSLYYQDHWFKKATFIQTGVTLKYFSDFNSNMFNPILNEFVVQDFTNLDGFYNVDVFFNAKLRTARLFFALENVTNLFNGNTNFTAPGYALRDFRFRFGLVWNFFL
ncbi:putative porin [Psychroflexus planctonicus]|uniref:Porin n=1 Tax=Psychroflexus planctonicus TaxID=1526575 RepID=A0ABQ1SET4_9FLAO|nr:putative porin [Psychroflexus planctonicus]GGE26127.1 hypothetical protein GCM10010832_03560 [Psychroflexus planctonicus]